MESKIRYTVINLERREDRKAECINLADSLGLDFQYFKAVDGSLLELDKVNEYNRNFRLKHYEDMKPGEVGVCLSFKACLLDFIGSDDDHMVLLEDDLSAPQNLPEFINKLIENYEGWDAIRLQRSKKQEGVKVAEVLGHSIVFPLRIGLCMTGVLYTKSGARKALRVFDSFFLPADEAMKFSHFKGLLMYEVNPIIVGQRDGLVSDIGGGNQRPPKSMSLWSKLLIKCYYLFGQGARVFLMPVAKLKFRKIK